jgi:hypothetical protein
VDWILEVNKSEDTSGLWDRTVPPAIFRKEREAISDGVSWRQGQTEQLAEVFAVTPAIFRESGDEKKG